MLELLALALIALPLYLVVRFGAGAVAWMSGRRFRAYRQLASRYRGKYENRGISDPPTVSFPYNGSTVRVGLAPPIPGQPSPPRTRVVVRFGRGLPLRLELAPVSRPAPPQPPKGTRPVRSGDPEFDRGFIVQANDPDMARDLLRVTEIRRAVGLLQRLGPPGGMLLSINPERMLVQVDRNLAMQVEPLAAAVREALMIHDGLLTGVAAKLAEGVNVIAAGPATAADSGPPLCKVCGQLIEGPRTVCTKCKAPHHRDCWEFIGSCSIFGCNGKEGRPE
jgi:hypothetical protein